MKNLYNPDDEIKNLRAELQTADDEALFQELRTDAMIGDLRDYAERSDLD